MIARAAFLIVVVGWSVSVASADPTSELTMSKSCREFLQKRMLAEPGALLLGGGRKEHAARRATTAGRGAKRRSLSGLDLDWNRR